MSPADQTVAVVARPPRLRFLDGLRGVAAIVIVLHHVCSYGPLPEASLAHSDLARYLVEGIWENGRLAVQVFLVISGFTAAYILPPGRLKIGAVGRLFLQRYLRLALPCAAAIALHFLLQFFVGERNLYPPLVEPFTVDQLGAHLLLLQNVLGYESLFVAYWYLGIEVQFSLLLLTLTALTRTWNPPAAIERANEQLLLILAGLATVSLVYWNTRPEYEAWAPYFLGSYFVGVLVAFITLKRCAIVHFFGYAVVTLFAANWPEPRVRPLLALAVGGLLLKASRSDGLETWLSSRPFRFLGRISYSLFLTHVPISRVILSLGFGRTGDDPTAAIGWMCLAVVVSLLFAWLFAETIERQLVKMISPTPQTKPKLAPLPTSPLPTSPSTPEPTR